MNSSGRLIKDSALGDKALMSAGLSLRRTLSATHSRPLTNKAFSSQILESSGLGNGLCARIPRVQENRVWEKKLKGFMLTDKLQICGCFS